MFVFFYKKKYGWILAADVFRAINFEIEQFPTQLTLTFFVI